MNNEKSNGQDTYWFDTSDLTIFDAALWMTIKSDPRVHHFRYAQDDLYNEAFNENPFASQSVYENCKVITSAIFTKNIETSRREFNVDQIIDPKSIYIYKSDWLAWLSKHHSDVVEFLIPKNNNTHKNNITIGESTKDWRVSAREIADNLFDKDTKMNCRRTLKNYAALVMDKMQELEIHGPRGRIDNPNTIMREALQGNKWWGNKVK